jgi:uncharacterized repeat protein (TIGR03806 family)
MRALLPVLLLGCSPAPPDGQPPAEEVDPDSLAALGLLSWDGSTFHYADGVVPYELATPLFSDFSLKARAIALPEGQSASYNERGVLTFPVGTRLVKSFFFPADFRAPTEDLRLIETRVLTLEEDGWDAWPFLWNEEQTEAMRAPSGDVLDLSFVDAQGEPVSFSYLVPQRNQCVDCHELPGGEERQNTPIGPTARNLHVGDQLERLAAEGVISDLPPLQDISAATEAASLQGVDLAALPDEVLLPAARDYLDINCAHCHHPEGTEGRSSQLFLNWDYEENPFHLGVCKKPGSAGNGTGGLTYDIVPGDPESSILWYRMQTAELGEMMPDLGRALVDERGVELVAEWIRRLEGTCSEP